VGVLLHKKREGQYSIVKERRSNALLIDEGKAKAALSLQSPLMKVTFFLLCFQAKIGLTVQEENVNLPPQS